MRGSRRSLQMLSSLFAYRERRSGPATAQWPMVSTLSRSAAAASMTPHWPARLLPGHYVEICRSKLRSYSGSCMPPSVLGASTTTVYLQAPIWLPPSLALGLEGGAVGVMHMSLVLITPM
ncbi:hypothetical protein PG985_010886 [Apiospora marii]|uniref:Uncharacterized protein n=1 Tax=Apiospora marii TaxID=335849 RepID=A0ABR1T288_9PEZI